MDYPTIPLADLLMTKLQIVELNEKDVKDMVYLLKDHELEKNYRQREGVDVKYIANTCAKDWGVYETFTSNIKKVMGLTDNYIQEHEGSIVVKRRLKDLLDAIELELKTIGWKMRAKIGRKKRWYSFLLNFVPFICS